MNHPESVPPRTGSHKRSTTIAPSHSNHLNLLHKILTSLKLLMAAWSCQEFPGLFLRTGRGIWESCMVKSRAEVACKGLAACCATSLSCNVTSSYLPSHISCCFLLFSLYPYLLPLHSRKLTPNPNGSNANAITPFLAGRKTSTLDGPGPWDRLAE